MSDEKPASKIDQMAEEARAAGEKFVGTDTGKKVADATDKMFDKADELTRQALDTDFAKKALASDLGQQASDFAKEAAEKTKAAIPNELARNVAVGAAAGAVLALPVPFIGPVFGAIVGAGLGYLRTITKNR